METGETIQDNTINILIYKQLLFELMTMRGELDKHAKDELKRLASTKNKLNATKIKFYHIIQNLQNK